MKLILNAALIITNKIVLVYFFTECVAENVMADKLRSVEKMHAGEPSANFLTPLQISYFH